MTPSCTTAESYIHKVRHQMNNTDPHASANPYYGTQSQGITYVLSSGVKRFGLHAKTSNTHQRSRSVTAALSMHILSVAPLHTLTLVKKRMLVLSSSCRCENAASISSACFSNAIPFGVSFTTCPTRSPAVTTGQQQATRRQQPIYSHAHTNTRTRLGHTRTYTPE